MPIYLIQDRDSGQRLKVEALLHPAQDTNADGWTAPSTKFRESQPTHKDDRATANVTVGDTKSVRCSVNLYHVLQNGSIQSIDFDIQLNRRTVWRDTLSRLTIIMRKYLVISPIFSLVPDDELVSLRLVIHTGPMEQQSYQVSQSSKYYLMFKYNRLRKKSVMPFQPFWLTADVPRRVTQVAQRSTNGTNVQLSPPQVQSSRARRQIEAPTKSLITSTQPDRGWAGRPTALSSKDVSSTSVHVRSSDLSLPTPESKVVRVASINEQQIMHVQSIKRESTSSQTSQLQQEPDVESDQSSSTSSEESQGATDDLPGSELKFERRAAEARRQREILAAKIRALKAEQVAEEEEAKLEETKRELAALKKKKRKRH